MPGGHHSCGSIEHRTEVVPIAQLGFAGRNPHPHRQLQRPLRGHRGIDRAPRRGERGTYTVAGVLEQPAPVCLDRLEQHLVMDGQRRPHRFRVGLPPTGRTLNIGEQKRHHPRRSSRRRISGHLSRISHQTRSLVAHRRNPAQKPTPRGTAQAKPLADCSGAIHGDDARRRRCAERSPGLRTDVRRSVTWKTTTSRQPPNGNATGSHPKATSCVLPRRSCSEPLASVQLQRSSQGRVHTGRLDISPRRQAAIMTVKSCTARRAVQRWNR